MPTKPITPNAVGASLPASKSADTIAPSAGIRTRDTPSSVAVEAPGNVATADATSRPAHGGSRDARADLRTWDPNTRTGPQYLAAFRALCDGGRVDIAGKHIAIQHATLPTETLERIAKTLLGSSVSIRKIDLGKWIFITDIAPELARAFATILDATYVDARGYLRLASATTPSEAVARASDVLFGQNTTFLNDCLVSRDAGSVRQDGASATPGTSSPTADLSKITLASVTKEGAADAARLAAMKAFISEAKVDATDTKLVIENRGLEPTHFHNATKTLFGSSGVADGGRTFTLEPRTPVEKRAVDDFKIVSDNLRVDANGLLASKSDAFGEPDRRAISSMFGACATVSNDRIVVDDRAFGANTITPTLVNDFGPSGAIDSSFGSKIAARAVPDMQRFGAVKALVGGTTSEIGSATLTLQNNDLQKAHFDAAIREVFGDRGAFDNAGRFTFTPTSPADLELSGKLTTLLVSTRLDSRGFLAIDPTKAKGDIRPVVESFFGPTVGLFNNRLLLDDRGVASADIESAIATRFGSRAAIGGSLTTRVTRDGIQDAHVLAGVKALIGGTTVDTTGSELVIRNERLEQAHFQAAVTQVFGANGQFDATGHYRWTPTGGGEVELASRLRTIFAGTRIDARGQLAVRPGVLDATLDAAIETTFGPCAFITNNRIGFDDRGFTHADIANKVRAQFGSVGSLDGSLRATITRQGIADAEMMGAFKALLSGTDIDVSSARITIRNNTLDSAHMTAAVRKVFGKNSSIGADGRFTFTPQGGIETDFAAKFGTLYKGVRLDGRGNIALRNGKIGGSLEGAIETILGPCAIASNGRLVFDDGGFQYAQLASRVETTFGPNASLATSFKGTIGRTGIEDAEIMAAAKALIGGAKIDTTGSRISIRNNKLEQAQFKAAVEKIFGSAARIDGNGTFTWAKETGTRGDLATRFSLVHGATRVDGSGRLFVENGKLSGEVQAAIEAMFGPCSFISRNQIVFNDNGFDSATLDETVRAKFGALGSLEASFKGTVRADGVRDANVFAAAKQLIGKVEVKADGTLRILDGKVREVRAALEVLSGTNVRVRGNTIVDLATTGRLADAQFRQDLLVVIGKTTVDANGTLHFDRIGLPEATLRASVRRVFGDRALTADGAQGDVLIRFDGTGLHLDRVAVSIDKRLGPADLHTSFTYDGAVQGTIGIRAFRALRILEKQGKLELTPDARVVIKDNKLDSVEVGSLVSLVAGEHVRVDGSGKLIFHDGRVNAEFSAKLSTCIAHTEVGTNGTLRVRDGKMEFAPKVQAMFEGASVGASGGIEFPGADGAAANMAVRAIGGKLVASGGLRLIDGEVNADIDLGVSLGVFGLDVGTTRDVQSKLTEDAYTLTRTMKPRAKGRMKLPTGIVTVSLGAMASRERRVNVRVPRASGLPSEADAKKLADSLGTLSLDAWKSAPSGAMVTSAVSGELAFDGEVSANIGYGLSQWASAGLEFGVRARPSKKHVLLLRAETDDATGAASLTLWQEDVVSLMRGLSVHLGVNLDLGAMINGFSVRTLVEKYVQGGACEGPMKNAMQLLEQIVEHYASMGFKHSVTDTTTTRKSMTFRFDNLAKSASQQHAWMELVQNYDPDRAKAAGLLVASRAEVAPERASETEYDGILLDIVSNTTTGAQDVDVTREIDGKTVNVEGMNEWFARKKRESFGFFFREDYDLKWQAFTVRAGPTPDRMKTIDTVCAGSFSSLDKATREPEAQCWDALIESLGLPIANRIAPGERRFFSALGKGEGKFEFAIRGPGLWNIVQSRPDVAQLAYVQICSRMLGQTSPPPSEMPFGELPFSARAIRLANRAHENDAEIERDARADFEREYPSIDIDRVHEATKLLEEYWCCLRDADGGVADERMWDVAKRDKLADEYQRVFGRDAASDVEKAMAGLFLAQYQDSHFPRSWRIARRYAEVTGGRDIDDDYMICHEAQQLSAFLAKERGEIVELIRTRTKEDDAYLKETGEQYSPKVIDKLLESVRQLGEQIQPGNFSIIMPWLRKEWDRDRMFFTSLATMLRLAGEENRAIYRASYVAPRFAIEAVPTVGKARSMDDVIDDADDGPATTVPTEFAKVLDLPGPANPLAA